jgi:hypothetical protein
MSEYLAKAVQIAQSLWARIWGLRPATVPELPRIDAPRYVPDDVREPPKAPDALIVKAEPNKATVKESPAESVIWGFRETILDRLEEYFICLRRMKKYDPDSYALFSRVGFTVPRMFVNPDHERFSRVTTPSAFGGVLLGRNTNQNNVGPDGPPVVHPSFLYYQKVKSPSKVQPFKGDVYSFTALWDESGIERYGKSHAYPTICHIGVGADGVPHLLKEALIKKELVRPKRSDKGKRRRQDAFFLTHLSWQYPAWAVEMANEHNTDPTSWVVHGFMTAILTNQESVSRIIVRASEGACVAAFGIELPTAKRFFKDRDATILAVDGKRKRIFHSVVAHQRVLKQGTTRVKDHYRGLRTFDWQGYGIHIVFPKVKMDYRFDCQYLEDTPKEERDTLLRNDEAGRRIAQVLAS